MDSLNYVKRNDEKFYCFVEVCQAVFPNIPKSTVRNWLKSLSIPTFTCVAEERSFFRQRNKSLGGSFGLIRHEDLLRLNDYQTKGPLKKRLKLSTAASTCTNNLNNIVSYCVSSDEELAEPKAVQDTLLHSDDPCTAVESQDIEANESPHKKPSYRYQLQIDTAPQKLKEEVSALRNFYSRELNPSRKGGPFSVATIKKMVERVMCFMFYCKNVKNFPDLSLSLFCNVDIYTDYLHYLRQERKLKPSTLVAHIIICINVVKYNLVMRDPAITNPEDSREVRAYQSFQRQFQKESRMLARCAKEGLVTSKASQRFYFEHVLETLRNIRDKYYETSGLAKLRHLHDFVLLATYLRAIPGRSKELRTMRLRYTPFEESELFDPTSVEASSNYIIFDETDDKRVSIVQFDFKTAKSIGPTKFDLSEDSDLVYFLQLYVRARASLMLGKVHNFFFLNKNGAPFDSSGAIAKYIGDIFQREVSIRASTNALRHAIVTYFSSLDESSDIDVRKSLALLMKHSVRHQELSYNDLTHHEKTMKGRNLMRKKLAANIFGELDCSQGSERAASDHGESSSDEFELKPAPGDIVALLDPISTKENVHFFLAKVARLTQNREEAHLMHLERVGDSRNMYKTKPGETWREAVRALIYPIDVVYNSSSCAYELRTSPEDIYDIVHGQK